MCYATHHVVSIEMQFYRVDDAEFNSLCEKRRSCSVYDVYVIVRKIQTGGQGTVYAGFAKTDRTPVAIKYVLKSKIKSWCVNGRQRVPAEILFMERLRHVEGVVRLVEYFELCDKYLLVLDRANNDQDLYDFITDNNYIDEKTSWKLFTQILRINANMYATNVVHRDIKDENIIINKETEAIKIIDFGTATFLTLDTARSYHATWLYAPPEMLRKSWCGHEGLLMWSLGILLYDMTHGDVPFHTKDQILDPVLKLKPELSSACRDFISGCLTADCSKRLSLEQAADHPWITTSR